jgi:hypothetical protein
VLYPLSAIDEYRTDEAKVPNNSFLIADISFNTYGKITEDTRKNDRREMIGIMPVITTAANAAYAQNLIDVQRQNVIGYETIGTITTLDVTKDLDLCDKFPKCRQLSPNIVKETDMAKLINTKTYYKYYGTVQQRVESIPEDFPIDPSEFDESGELTSQEDVRQRIAAALQSNGISISAINKISANCATFVDTDNSWDGSFNVTKKYGLSGEIVSAWAGFSYIGEYTVDGIRLMKERAEEAGESDLAAKLQAVLNKKDEVFGWHNPAGDDAIPETVSQEANTYFPTLDTMTVTPDRYIDNDTGFRFVRDNLKKIGVIVYKMFLDPSEGNKINFEPVEAYAGSLCKDDKDPNTGATTFIDTIINSQSQYINFFSNCFNTAKDKKYYRETLDMLVMQPGAAHPSEMATIEISKVRDFPKAIDLLSQAVHLDLHTDSVEEITFNIDQIEEALD